MERDLVTGLQLPVLPPLLDPFEDESCVDSDWFDTPSGPENMVMENHNF